MARRPAKTSNRVNPSIDARPKRGRAAWLIFAGLLAGIAGGAFAWRILAPEGEPVRPTESVPDDVQPQELVVPTEPVEISTRMRPGEWTEESLAAHIEDYKQQIRNMGATDAEIVTNIERTEEGAARVVVTWNRSGVQGNR